MMARYTRFGILYRTPCKVVLVAPPPCVLLLLRFGYVRAQKIMRAASENFTTERHDNRKEVDVQYCVQKQHSFPVYLAYV